MMALQFIIKDMDRLLLSTTHSVNTCIWSLFFYFFLIFNFLKNTSIANIAILIIINYDSCILITAIKYIPNTTLFFCSINMQDGSLCFIMIMFWYDLFSMRFIRIRISWTFFIEIYRLFNMMILIAKILLFFCFK